MSIDAKKLKRLLTRHEILPIEYFCFKGEQKCALVKCFLHSCSQFLLLYIPSKYRFDVREEKDVYDLEDIHPDPVDEDDYSHLTDEDSKRYSDAELQEQRTNKYQALQQKYHRTLTAGDDDEPLIRKLNRQCKRLYQPLSKSSYDFSLQHERMLSVSFDGTPSFYHIKSYSLPKDMVRCMMFVVTLTDIIDKIEELNDEIGRLSDKFLSLLIRVSDSNMAEMANEIENSDFVCSKLAAKRDDLARHVRDDVHSMEKLRKEETRLLDEYQLESVKAKSSHDRVRVTDDLQKEIDAVFHRKNELTRKNITHSLRYHQIVLHVEEISFDNSVMIDRVRKNFQLLRALVA